MKQYATLLKYLSTIFAAYCLGFGVCYKYFRKPLPSPTPSAKINAEQPFMTGVDLGEASRLSADTHNTNRAREFLQSAINSAADSKALSAETLRDLNTLVRTPEDYGHIDNAISGIAGYLHAAQKNQVPSDGNSP
jgi:hypothetical protein